MMSKFHLKPIWESSIGVGEGRGEVRRSRHNRKMHKHKVRTEVRIHSLLGDGGKSHADRFGIQQHNGREKQPI